MPCGQKKSKSEMIQSQTVTPPLAAMDGTTFKLNTATTKRRTRSQRPRTRFRCGWLPAVGSDKSHSRFQGFVGFTVSNESQDVLFGKSLLPESLSFAILKFRKAMERARAPTPHVQ